MSKILFYVVLILGIIFSVYLVSQKTQYFSKASPDIAPKSVTFSNISDKSITVSYVTDKPTIGILNYSEDESYKLASYDERDQTNPQGRTTHYIVLRDLSPNKNYNIKIGEQTFKQQTAPVSENTPPLPVLVYGKIKDKVGNPKQAIVYLKMSSATTLSTVSGEDGNWLITVTNARKQDLSNYVEVLDGDLAEVWAQAGVDDILEKKQIKLNTQDSLADFKFGSSDEKDSIILSFPKPDEIVYEDLNKKDPSFLDNILNWVKKVLKQN